jgi:hypothetical protein
MTENQPDFQFPLAHGILPKPDRTPESDKKWLFGNRSGFYKREVTT